MGYNDSSHLVGRGRGEAKGGQEETQSRNPEGAFGGLVVLPLYYHIHGFSYLGAALL